MVRFMAAQDLEVSPTSTHGARARQYFDRGVDVSAVDVGTANCTHRSFGLDSKDCRRFPAVLTCHRMPQHTIANSGNHGISHLWRGSHEITLSRLVNCACSTEAPAIEGTRTRPGGMHVEVGTAWCTYRQCPRQLSCCLVHTSQIGRSAPHCLLVALNCLRRDRGTVVETRCRRWQWWRGCAGLPSRRLRLLGRALSTHSGVCELQWSRLSPKVLRGGDAVACARRRPAQRALAAPGRELAAGVAASAFHGPASMRGRDVGPEGRSGKRGSERRMANRRMARGRSMARRD